MCPSPEQKAFLRTHSITRCPPAPSVGMFWKSDWECSETDLLKSYGTMPENLTLSEQFEISKLERERRREKRFPAARAQSSSIEH